MSSEDETESIDHGEYWRIEELDTESEIYTFVGRGGPPSSEAVAKAKQQFAQDYDVKYQDCVAKKIDTAPGRAGGAIVVVVHQPKHASHEVLP